MTPKWRDRIGRARRGRSPTSRDPAATPLPADGCRCQSPIATRSSGCNQSGICARTSASRGSFKLVCPCSSPGCARAGRIDDVRGASSRMLPGPEMSTSLEMLARELADLAKGSGARRRPEGRSRTGGSAAQRRPTRGTSPSPSASGASTRRAASSSDAAVGRPAAASARPCRGGAPRRGRCGSRVLLERSVPGAHERLQAGTAEG